RARARGPGGGCGREVGPRIRDGLAPEPRYRWLVPQFALAACVTLLIVSVVWLGRGPSSTSGTGAGAVTTASSGSASSGAGPAVRQEPQSAATIRDRVLVAAGGDHLQRAELML